MKRQNYFKSHLPWQSEFDHKYACWATNHRGWAKCKKANKKLAKTREKRAWQGEASRAIMSEKEENEMNDDEQVFPTATGRHSLHVCGDKPTSGLHPDGQA